MYRFSKVFLIYLLCSPFSRTPIEPIKTCLNALILLSATERTVSTSTYQIYEADLFHAFTNGSHTLLSTLKPNVTTSAPRLDTSCWLDFTGLAFNSNYILKTELSHSLYSFSNSSILSFQVYFPLHFSFVLYLYYNFKFNFLSIIFYTLIV